MEHLNDSSVPNFFEIIASFSVDILSLQEDVPFPYTSIISVTPLIAINPLTHSHLNRGPYTLFEDRSQLWYVKMVVSTQETLIHIYVEYDIGGLGVSYSLTIS